MGGHKGPLKYYFHIIGVRIRVRSDEDGLKPGWIRVGINFARALRLARLKVALLEKKETLWQSALQYF